MSYDLNHYNSPNLRHTLKEMNELAGKKTKNFCCVNTPLINIELDHVILDELHLLLRIMDVLIKNLVTESSAMGPGRQLEQEKEGSNKYSFR